MYVTWSVYLSVVAHVASVHRRCARSYRWLCRCGILLERKSSCNLTYMACRPTTCTKSIYVLYRTQSEIADFALPPAGAATWRTERNMGLYAWSLTLPLGYLKT